MKWHTDSFGSRSSFDSTCSEVHDFPVQGTQVKRKKDYNGRKITIRGQTGSVTQNLEPSEATSEYYCNTTILLQNYRYMYNNSKSFLLNGNYDSKW